MYDAGTLTADLSGTDGATMVGTPTGTVQDKLDETASVKDFGAVGDGVADDTAAIQAAIDSEIRNIYFPPGTYRHGALVFDNTYQHFRGAGAILLRTSALVTVSITARGVVFWGLEFSGGGLSGNNLTVSAPEAAFWGCTSRNTLGRCLYAFDDGGNLEIRGGIWNTLDHTGAGYEFEFKDTVVGTSLYSKIQGISTQQSYGGVLIDGQGTMKFTDCQFGKLTVLRGGGSFVNNRIIGDVSIQGDICLFDNNAFAGNITFGDGAGGNIGGHNFGSTNIVQSGRTLTINSDVIESSFFLSQLANVTLVLNGPNNDIWHGRRAYVPALQASGGAPALGNGTLTGGYTRSGREVVVDFEFVGGSTTNYGAGEFYITLPFKSLRYAIGSALVTKDGVRSYVANLTCAAGQQRVAMMMADTGGDQNAGATYPFAWGDQDRFRGQIAISYSA
jgi:hypothetical protein